MSLMRLGCGILLISFKIVSSDIRSEILDSLARSKKKNGCLGATKIYGVFVGEKFLL